MIYPPIISAGVSGALVLSKSWHGKRTFDGHDGIQMLIAAVPAFAAGLTEDFIKRVGVSERLLATMLSGLLAAMLTGYAITRSDIPALDAVFSFMSFSVAFTAFAVGGAANGVNVIDGFNGLAGGVLMICFTVLCLIALWVGGFVLVQICFLMTLSVAGFMAVKKEKTKKTNKRGRW